MGEQKQEEAPRAETPEIEVEVVEASALEAIQRAEIDVQIATAKRWPRSITDFKRRALELATLDEETAASCFYSLERWDSAAGKKKIIQGPSARLMEIAAMAYGNMRTDSQIVSTAGSAVVVRSFAHDLERNVAEAVTVRRKITTKEGRRFSEDMVNVTAMAALSIASRNAKLKIIPRALIAPVYAECLKTSLGTALTMEQRRERVIKAFEGLGANLNQVLLLLRKKGKDDISVDDLLHLRGLKTAIEEGDITLAEALREATGIVEPETVTPPEPTAPKVTSEAVAEGSAKGKDQPKGAGHQEPAAPKPAVGEKDEKGREVLERDERGPTVVKKAPKAETPEEQEAEKLFE